MVLFLVGPGLYLVADQANSSSTIPADEDVMHSLASVEIDRPIDEVFQYTNEKVAEWSLTVVEDKLIEDKNGVGTTFLCVTEENGRRMDFDGVVTRWNPPTVSAISLTGKSFDIEAEYRFEDLNGGRTRVTQESTVSGKGFVKVMFFLFGWLMNKQGCKAVTNELESLKQKLESGAGQA
jgi:uncharacterized membrane protein